MWYRQRNNQAQRLSSQNRVYPNADTVEAVEGNINRIAIGDKRTVRLILKFLNAGIIEGTD